MALAEWSPPRPGARAFVIGVPALDAFPTTLWGRMVARLGRGLRDDSLSCDHPAGHGPLREAIAAYLAAARGVRCAADQVIIVNGSQEALLLIAHVLLNPGDGVWVEEPGYFGTKRAMLGAGAHLAPVPVDREGLDVAAGQAMCPGTRLAFVTPSHQMPMGVMLSLPRRLALLGWARAAGARVVEDEYDSEFRYASRPLAERQGVPVQAARRTLAGQMEVLPAESGTHVLGWLPSGTDDQAVARAAGAQGVRVLALSRQYGGAPAQKGLLLGYAAIPPVEIIEGVRGLGQALRSLPPGK